MTSEALQLQDSQHVRVGYLPYSNELDMPGDRRRFAFYASRRGIRFEIADPAKEYDLVILSARADVSVWSQYPKAKLVYDLIDSYLAIPRTDLKGQLRGLFKFLSRQSRYLQLDHLKAISGMCARANAVVCTTEEQRQDILKYCNNVHTILDAHMGVHRRTPAATRLHPRSAASGPGRHAKPHQCGNPLRRAVGQELDRTVPCR